MQIFEAYQTCKMKKWRSTTGSFFATGMKGHFYQTAQAKNRLGGSQMIINDLEDVIKPKEIIFKLKGTSYFRDYQSKKKWNNILWRWRVHLVLYYLSSRTKYCEEQLPLVDRRKLWSLSVEPTRITLELRLFGLLYQWIWSRKLLQDHRVKTRKSVCFVWNIQGLCNDKGLQSRSSNHILLDADYSRRSIVWQYQKTTLIKDGSIALRQKKP